MSIIINHQSSSSSIIIIVVSMPRLVALQFSGSEDIFRTKGVTDGNMEKPDSNIPPTPTSPTALRGSYTDSEYHMERARSMLSTCSLCCHGRDVKTLPPLSVDLSQAPNGRLCRVAVTDLGELAAATTIRGRGLLGCVLALRSATSNVSQHHPDICLFVSLLNV